MNKGNLKCSLNCDEIETQIHIFENFEPVLSRLNLSQTLPLNSIFGSLSEQKSAVELFLKIDKIRRLMINNLLPGEDIARTQDILQIYCVSALDCKKEEETSSFDSLYGMLQSKF